MSYEAIAIIMFGSMLVMLLTGQRVFAAIGIVSTVAALLLWGRAAWKCRSPPRSSCSSGIRC